MKISFTENTGNESISTVVGISEEDPHLLAVSEHLLQLLLLFLLLTLLLLQLPPPFQSFQRLLSHLKSALA
jgi:hypothetical protein